MGKKIGQVDEDTRRVVTWKPKRVKVVDFPVTVVSTRTQRLLRALKG